MNFDATFFINSAMLGLGLAMDAFSVSLANGLNEQCMKKNKMLYISGIFAFFQALMPLIGWVCVHTIAERFSQFEKFVPWIALLLLCFIGGKMLIEGIRGVDSACVCRKVGIWGLLIQGIATSIDALSVGFTISEYMIIEALICAIIIALITFVVCFAGVNIGKKFGTKLANKASIFGGVILILIGIEIFVMGMLGL